MNVTRFKAGIDALENILRSGELIEDRKIVKIEIKDANYSNALNIINDFKIDNNFHDMINDIIMQIKKN